MRGSWTRGETETEQEGGRIDSQGDKMSERGYLTLSGVGPSHQHATRSLLPAITGEHHFMRLGLRTEAAQHLGILLCCT